MTREQIMSGVNSVLVQSLCISDGDIKGTDELHSDLTMESLDRVEIVMALEDEFNIAIEGEDDWITVDDVYNCVEKEVNG